MDLIIVESPTKAKTLGKFLGSGYRVAATMGHIRDLPEKSLGIKIDTRIQESKNPRIQFVLDYVQTAKQKERTKELIALAKGAKTVFLASDPDREGEAIAWHVATLIKIQKSKNPKIQRICFHEITEKAVKQAIGQAGEINMALVDAQQARRVIDRLVGYKLSPLLWAKVRRGLSAGRVQSVAVRLVCEKEEEINKFEAEEYWEIDVKIQKFKDSKIQFWVKLVNKIKNGEEAERAVRELKGSDFWVENVEKKDFKRSPPPPFTTSVLQQTAANKFGWTPKRTMQVAQSLYEQGFITYHRTDSTNIAQEALLQAGELIVNQFGSEYALDKPRFYKTKSKVAQEAHEAIRPTDVSLQASAVGRQLNKDQEKLYELIWRRFVACQMQEARGESVRVKVKAGDYSLEAKGETINFDGWYKINNSEIQESNDSILPELEEGEKLELADIKSEQKFTLPPARYNEASLIKKLEELGIGRPSTYAPILAAIQDRQYVEKVERRLKPTALGVAANEFLTKNFAKIMDYKFTARMEDDLDEIADGRRDWQETVGEFWLPLSKEIDDIKQNGQRVKVEAEKTGEICPKCGQGDVIVRIGKFGRFLACSRFPECDFRANFVNKIGIKCPKCDGEVILRKTRSGKNFYGCSNYPNCDFASWNKPKQELK